VLVFCSEFEFCINVNKLLRWGGEWESWRWCSGLIPIVIVTNVEQVIWMG
jgi:hypothetical protein